MKYLNIITIALAIMVISACGSRSSSYTKLGKIEVQVPAELRNKPEVINYIDGMTEVANSYALMIDNTLEDVGEYIGVDESELGMMDKLKLVKATAEVSMQSVEIMGKWTEFTQQRAQINEQLSDAELEALNNIWKQFDERMIEIQKKYDTALQAEDSTNEANADENV
jgi:hypothetical protein